MNNLLLEKIGVLTLTILAGAGACFVLIKYYSAKVMKERGKSDPGKQE